MSIAKWVMMVVVVTGIAMISTGCKETADGDSGKSEPPKDHPAH